MYKLQRLFLIGSCIFFAATIYSMFCLSLVFIIVFFVLHSLCLFSFCYICYSDQVDKALSLNTYHQEVGIEIAEKDKGLQEPIAQGGTNVSGGQKQRISIAIALVRKPDIYIFDDSFSALDFRTDKALRKALKEYAKGSTVIIVAQRINTILDADRILVLNEGRIVGSGTHSELLGSCEVYQEIARSQLSDEELVAAAPDGDGETVTAAPDGEEERGCGQ